jgi:hypothetical protein
MQARQSLRLQHTNPLRSDLHAYLWMNLVNIGINIYIGADLNSPHLWFYLGLSFLVMKKTAPSPSVRKTDLVPQFLPATA